MIYFTSDLHIGHQKIISLENRPYIDIEDMNENIVAEFNRCVQKSDIVYLLGDVCFHFDKNLKYLKRLNGNKFICLGNHDYGITKIKLKMIPHIVWICDYKRIKTEFGSIVLSHYPCQLPMS